MNTWNPNKDYEEDDGQDLGPGSEQELRTVTFIQVRHETPHAWLLQTYKKRSFWFAKSECSIEYECGGGGTVEAPESFLNLKGIPWD